MHDGRKDGLMEGWMKRGREKCRLEYVTVKDQVLNSEEEQMLNAQEDEWMYGIMVCCRKANFWLQT